MAGPTFTCTDCGTGFSLPADILERYPGWTPKQCRSCKNGRSSGRGGAQSGRGNGRRGGTPSRRGADGGVEENLTVEEVLETYSGGPQTGVFTDGSAHPNPGPGGWGAVYVRNGTIIDRAYGAADDTTNNRMELTALIAAYDLVPPGESAVVYTDSRLCVDTITKWAPGWKRKGWKRKSGPVQNLDLVKTLYERAQQRPELRLEWIKAHDGSLWNEYADALSTAYRRAQV